MAKATAAPPPGSSPTPGSSPATVTRAELDVPVTLFAGTRPEVTGHATLLQLLRRCCTEPDLLAHGRQLRELAARRATIPVIWPDYAAADAAYKRIKERSLGFVLGDFSHRDLASMNALAPMVGLDVDSLATEAETLALLDRLRDWPLCAAALPSPSYRGLRVLVLVATTSTEGYADRYRRIARDLCRYLDLPIKRDLRDRMNLAGLDSATQQRVLDTTPHGDDAVSDYSRLWFITGLPAQHVYVATTPQVWSPPAAVVASKTAGMFGTSAGGGYEARPETNEELVETLLAEVESGRIDITQGVAAWYKIGQALYSALGRSGETYFLRLSAFHPDFKSRDAVREWDRICRKHKPGVTGLGSLVYICRDYGIEVMGLGGGGPGPAVLSPSKAVARNLGAKSVPEQNVSLDEAQRCLVANLVAVPGAPARLMDALPHFAADAITHHAYREVYRTVRELQLADRPIDPVVVAARTAQRGHATAAEQVPELLGRDHHPDSFLTQARLIYDEFRYARLRGMAPTLLESVGRRDEITDLVAGLRQAADSLEDDGVRRTEYTASDIADAIQDHVERMLRLRRSGQTLVGISTGLAELDRAIGGWQPSQYYIIAGRPAMGKSALMLKHIYAAAVQGLRVLVFSVEMTLHDLSLRLASLHTATPLTHILRGTLSERELAQLIQALDEIAGWGIKIDDDGGLTPSQFQARCARAMREEGGGYDLVLLDYLQFMSWELDKSNAVLNVGHASKVCKHVAKQHAVPVVALAQLSRAVETRGGDKRPQLSDLKESGNIEQDADCVMFIYRPEYYKIMEDGQGNSLRGVAEIIIGKNRHGQATDVRVGFDGSLTLFHDLDDLDFAAVSEVAPKATSLPPPKAAPPVDHTQPLYGSQGRLTNEVLDRRSDRDLPF